MCKFNKKSGNRRIDPCMRILINSLSTVLNKQFKTVACCCGHGKYKMTIIIKIEKNLFFDLVSGKYIHRKKRFYVKDRKGYYYIPEVDKEKK